MLKTSARTHRRSNKVSSFWYAVWIAIMVLFFTVDLPHPLRISTLKSLSKFQFFTKASALIRPDSYVARTSERRISSSSLRVLAARLLKSRIFLPRENSSPVKRTQRVASRLSAASDFATQILRAVSKLSAKTPPISSKFKRSAMSCFFSSESDFFCDAGCAAVSGCAADSRCSAFSRCAPSTRLRQACQKRDSSDTINADCPRRQPKRIPSSGKSMPNVTNAGRTAKNMR